MFHSFVPPSGSCGHASPVVGRLAGRALLGEELLSARSGSCRVAVIGGEAGIGKTTLARLVADEACNTGFKVLVGHNQDLMATSPFGPWPAMLERLQHECAGIELAPVFRGTTVGDIASQDDVFVQMRDFLRWQANVAPLLLVFEDAHWADPASLDLLWHPAGYGLAAPIMILMTHRLDEPRRGLPFHLRLPALSRLADVLRIDLRPFTRVELRADRLGSPARDDLAVAAVVGQDVPIALWTRVAGTSDLAILDIVDAAVDASLVGATPV